MKTYLFYDIETSGLSKPFDQVLQFAAIRTDLAFNELERHEIHVKPNCDVIPAPGAVITHLLSMNDTQHGISEWEALEKIHALLNYPDTISLGYNTLGFDDEFLRYSFYRNLLPPYTHQYANRCSRMDLYPIAALYYLFKPNVLSWPMNNGSLSLKLENLNAANQFCKGMAHNAMVDVEATVQLARAFAKETAMWEYTAGYFDKRLDQERFFKLPTSFQEMRTALYIEGSLGAKLNFQAPLLHLGEHRHYKNQQIFLRMDLPLLRETTPDTVAKNTWSIRKKWGEPGFLLPEEPRFLTRMESQRLEEYEKNKKWIAENPTLHSAITDYHLEFKYPVYPETDVDAALYISDFWSPRDINQCAEFHRASNKAALINQFNNPYLEEMALRVVGRHFHEQLSTQQQQQFAAYRQQALFADLIDFRGEKRLSVSQGLTEIETLYEKNNLSDIQKSKLTELKTYLTSLAE